MFLVTFKNINSIARELQGGGIFVGRPESLCYREKYMAKYEIIDKTISMLSHAEGRNRVST
jgi:hypothetical protein